MSKPSIQTANRRARDAAKRALRRYGEITSGLRPGPDFIIVGAKRGGTTSLYNYLLEHPSIAPLFPARQRIKGVHYFDSEFARGGRWYRSHFPLSAGGRHIARPARAPGLTGEASPYYLFHPLAAERIARDYPGMRLIVLLRDPVERAYSHYKERVRHGAESLSFEDALDAEVARLRGEVQRIVSEPGYRSVAHEHHSYLAQGRYADMLPRWFGLFPCEQFHIVVSEEFHQYPARVVNDVWSFLGLAPAELRSRTRHNYHPAPDLTPATRRRLQHAFAAHNRDLEQMLGRSLPWPAAPAAPPAHLAAARQRDRILQTDALRRTATGLPPVAVVVPTRDRPVLLQRAVASILGQSYLGDLECVVVFDQSAPAPVPVDVPAGRRLRLVTNVRTPGLAGARNSGILASESALVAFCDDDDEWHPEKLRLQVKRLEAAQAEFVACGTRFHYSDRVIPRRAPSSVTFGQLIRKRFPEMGAPTFVVRRDALDAIGLVDEKIPGGYGEDYDLLLRAARRRPIVAVEQTLVDVYWHEQSFFAERWQTITEALRYLLGKHPELTADPRGLARIQAQIAFAEAALAHRPAAGRASWRALRNSPRERRAYLALAVALGIIPATSVVRLANRRGRGI